MLTRREDKYTSASPRCTCLSPRQHCAGVALGSPPPTPQHCWFGRRSSTTRLRLVVLASSSSTMLWSCTRCPPQTPMQWWFGGRTSTPRLRLGVLAFLLINIALKLHSEESKYISAAPRCTCFPPCATSAQVHRGQVQVQLGFASLYLDLALVDLSGVYVGHLVQLQFKSTAAKSRFNSASPRWTWTWPWWTCEESAVDYLVQPPAQVVQVKSRSNSASPRWTWTWPELPEPGSVRYTSATVRLILK